VYSSTVYSSLFCATRSRGDGMARPTGESSSLPILLDAFRVPARSEIDDSGPLEALPALARALSTGELNWSAVRELTRVAVQQNELEWLEFARGKTLRQLEDVIAGKHWGDRPDTRQTLPPAVTCSEGPTTSRASQTIPPSIRRTVLVRDQRRCQVPGCRNTRFFDVHHLELRSEGGPHSLPRREALVQLRAERVGRDVPIAHQL
jgi:hypothetical protein